jgi:hypothetical protein
MALGLAIVKLPVRSIETICRYGTGPSGCAVRVGSRNPTSVESGADRNAMQPLCNSSHNNAFLDELRKLGWVEGTTIDIERKDPDYRPGQLPVLAADLVRSKPDLIVAFTPQAARAAKDATSDIPIVILFVADPVAMGLA